MINEREATEIYEKISIEKAEEMIKFIFDDIRLRSNDGFSNITYIHTNTILPPDILISHWDSKVVWKVIIDRLESAGFLYYEYNSESYYKSYERFSYRRILWGDSKDRYIATKEDTFFTEEYITKKEVTKEVTKETKPITSETQQEKGTIIYKFKKWLCG